MYPVRRRTGAAISNYKSMIKNKINISDNETGAFSNGMYNTIKETAKQFAFEPKIENEENFHRTSKYILVGMGGSHLAADLLKMIKPEIDIIIHRDYGLPTISASDLKERLIILNSYSGNTEEVLDAYDEARRIGLQRAVISIGGKLLEMAKKDKIVYIKMPDFGIQPRSALPLNLKGLLKLIGEETTLKEVGELQNTFHPEDFEGEGKMLAEKLRGYIPIIYASAKNEPLAYNWKIKFNETGKIPAFYNVFSELNHNEMIGFSAGGKSASGGDVYSEVRNLSEKFYFLFLHDSEDHPQIQKRMAITAKLYEDRVLPTYKIELSGNAILHKIFNLLTLADFTAYFTAEGYGLESEQVPMVEEFKGLIQK